MDPESTAAKEGKGNVKTESADEGDNTSNLVIESVTSLNTAVTTVDHLSMMKQEVPLAPTIVKTEVEEISDFEDEFSGFKTEPAGNSTMKPTLEESAATSEVSSDQIETFVDITGENQEDLANQNTDDEDDPDWRMESNTRLVKNTSGISSSRHNKTRVDSQEPPTGVRRRRPKKVLEPDELVKELLDGKVLQPDQLELLEELRSRMDFGDASTLSYSDGPKRHLCLVCAYKTHVPSHMAKHLRCHDGEKLFACRDCDYRCVKSSSLATHRRLHAGKKSHVCNFCGYRTNCSGTLKIHLRRHTEFDVELLIKAVCNRPALWDKSLDIYKDRNKVAKSWVEVCKVINEDFAALSIAEQKKFEKDVIRKWKTLRGSYRKALERIKKGRRYGVPASKMKKYIFHEQMDFLRKVFDSRVTEDTFGNENSSQESAETETQDPMPCALPTTSQETQASIKKRPNETRKPDEFEAKFLGMGEVPNRHIAFMQGLLPTLENLTDDEVLEFQAGTLTLIQNIKRARRIRPYSAPPQFAKQHQAPQNIGWGYASTPQQIQQHHSLITAPQYSQELSQAHYHQPTSVTSSMTQISDAETPSPSSTLFQNTE